jgi:hypothetical protein
MVEGKRGDVTQEKTREREREDATSGLLNKTERIENELWCLCYPC